MSFEQSGRAWKFADILAKATGVFGSQAEAEQWLDRPAIGLDQHRSIDLLTTPAGLELVEDSFAPRIRRLHMTLLPAALGGDELAAWRLDLSMYAAAWDSGEGAFRNGGRWNSKGVRAVYCSIDPSTAILEVAVHKGFRTLDTVPHVMTAALIAEIAGPVHVVEPGALPNPNWLHPGIPSAGQQAFGDELLRNHRFVAIPSAVSKHSWNKRSSCA